LGLSSIKKTSCFELQILQKKHYYFRTTCLLVSDEYSVINNRKKKNGLQPIYENTS